MTRQDRRALRASAYTLALGLGSLCHSLAAHEGHGAADAETAMVVVSVIPSGPADVAGLAEGDRIVSWSGERLRTQSDLEAFLSTRKSGDAVRLDVERSGGAIVVELILGDRGDGTPSLGLALALEAPNQTSPAARDEVSRDECRTWLADTYRVAPLAAELGLDLEEALAETRECVDENLAQMAPAIPRGWCDNIFKIHCSALDLLAEIGDALIDRCEVELGASLGLDLAHDRSWNVCGEQRVADAYSMAGAASDAAACRRILVEECGGGIGRE